MIDAWQGPTPSPQQWPRREENGIRRLLDKIDAIALQAKESTSNLLGSAGLRLTRAGLFIDSSLTVGGSLDVTGPMVVGGTLSLPAGIIDNDALANPVMPQRVGATGYGFSLSTSGVNKAATTITVPAGFTKAVVTVTGKLIATNPGAASSLYAVVQVDGWSTDGVYAYPVDAGGLGVIVSIYSDVMTGLTAGDTFVISMHANASNAWAADPANVAVLAGIITWYR